VRRLIREYLAQHGVAFEPSGGDDTSPGVRPR